MCGLQSAECGLVNPACESIYLQSISPNYVLEIRQLCRRDSGLEMHGLDLGLDKTDPISATPSLLSGSVGHGGCSMVTGGTHLPVLVQLANEFMLTRETKMKLRQQGM